MEGLHIDFGFCTEENKKQSEYFEQRINFIWLRLKQLGYVEIELSNQLES